MRIWCSALQLYQTLLKLCHCTICGAACPMYLTPEWCERFSPFVLRSEQKLTEPIRYSREFVTGSCVAAMEREGEGEQRLEAETARAIASGKCIELRHIAMLGRPEPTVCHTL